MSTEEGPKIGKYKKATHFGCGAGLGFFVGLYFIAKWTVMSFGVAAGIWTVAILACGYLAYRYGDAFWYDLFGRDK